MTSGASFCKLSVEETALKLHTSLDTGLSDAADLAHRRSVHGPNALEADDDENMVLKFVSTFYEDPLVLMLIVSAVISFLLGNRHDALSITFAILFVVSVGFVQEYRSEQSLKALNNLVPPTCHLVRSGKVSNVLADGLVPGDLIKIRVGDRIPADLRITKASHLQIDESSLTGETRPVDKTSDACSGPDVPVAERTCIAHMGTLVTGGHGMGLVVGTNRDTEFGTIFYMMSEIDKPKTPLQQSMAKLGTDLSKVSFCVIGVICLIGIFQGRSLLEMFQIGVSLAVAAIPEGLPIIVTVTLALGVLRMAKNNAIVRRLPSVETLGCVDVVCSDKTGTLTLNKLTTTKLYTAEGWLDLHHSSDPHITPSPAVAALLNAGSICNGASYSESCTWLGNPVDVALMNVLEKFNLEDAREGTLAVSEVPFSSSRKWQAVQIKNTQGQDWAYVKGALEMLLPMCTHYTDSSAEPAPLDEERRNRIVKDSDEMAAQGMRIIAVAYKQNETQIQEPQGLVFAGLAAMHDPPRPGVKDSIRKLVKTGVKIIMVTGDNELTAASAAREVGIPLPAGHDSNFIMNGSTLEALSPEQLRNAIQNIVIFARTSPELKVKIVESLQLQGHIVAMTGDGVNDAPALKLADIGVSMGSGTDVAKEASDMILIDDSFSTILHAINQGKAIFSNIKSFLSFQLSTSVAALLLIAVSTLFGLPNPLNAMQILWINILMDGPPAQSLGVEPVGPEVIAKPPRKRTDAVLTQKLLRKVLLRGVMILVGTFLVYIREMADDGVSARDTTMSFTCFVLFDLFNALTSRSAERSVFDLGFFSNKMFNVSVSLSLLGQLLVIYFPPLQAVFQTEALSLGDLAFLVTLASSIWWVDELLKYRAKQGKRMQHPMAGIV